MKLAEDLGVSFSAAKIISDHAQPGVIFNCPSCGRIWDSNKHNACQCGAIIAQKPGVTEEWIEEKAERFMLQCPGGMLHSWASVKRFIKDFIRSLVEEIQCEK